MYNLLLVFELNIPKLKDPKEDNWRFTSNKSFGCGIDSCIDSGPGSLLCSYTFSLSPSTSGRSRGSPQSLQESKRTTNFWNVKKNWGAPSSVSLNTKINHTQRERKSLLKYSMFHVNY